MTTNAIDIPPDPARDGPTCPACGMERVGTPIARDTMVERWDGPIYASLFCPACGHGWWGTPEDMARAWASWRAYEREERGEGSCPKCCGCPHPKDAHSNASGCSGLIGATACPCPWDWHYHPVKQAGSGP